MPAEPVSIDSTLKELRAGRLPRLAVVAEAAPTSGILIQDLIQEFGLGGSPQLRRTLYERLARLERAHGQRFMTLLDEARSLARAPTVRNKGNYFAHAICVKVREAALEA